MIDDKILFPSGTLIITPRTKDALQTVSLAPSRLLDRHLTGDWGVIYDEDKEANNEGIETGD